ncbi:MAG: hypothetical protein ACOYJ1_05510 [Peptococcales bacterium]|jgi:hypothetical protein
MINEDVRLKKVKNLVAVSYYAYNKPPFDTDAIGYVPANKLLDPYYERYSYIDRNDELTARAGFEFVWTVPVDERDQREFYIVRRNNMYTEVFEHEGISGGWAANYPGGGITSTGKPTHIDEEGNLYNKVLF